MIGFVFAGLAYCTGMTTYTTVEVATDYTIPVQTNSGFATWRGNGWYDGTWHLLSDSEVICNKLWVNTEPCIC